MSKVPLVIHVLAAHTANSIAQLHVSALEMLKALPWNYQPQNVPVSFEDSPEVERG